MMKNCYQLCQSGVLDWWTLSEKNSKLMYLCSRLVSTKKRLDSGKVKYPTNV